MVFKKTADYDFELVDSINTILQTGSLENEEMRAEKAVMLLNEACDLLEGTKYDSVSLKIYAALDSFTRRTITPSENVESEVDEDVEEQKD
jgi:hypothetical protein